MIVINGVIELGIRNSVKEVPRFFRRIRYRIGEHHYSADDIEHGILRANHRLPNSLLDREFLANRAETLAVTYQDYDWRLNRS